MSVGIMFVWRYPSPHQKSYEIHSTVLGENLIFRRQNSSFAFSPVDLNSACLLKTRAGLTRSEVFYLRTLLKHLFGYWELLLNSTLAMTTVCHLWLIVWHNTDIKHNSTKLVGLNKRTLIFNCVVSLSSYILNNNYGDINVNEKFDNELVIK